MAVRRRLSSHGFCLKITSPASSGRLFTEKDMKNEFAFLFPNPKKVLVRDDFFDIRDLCFPLEIYKKYDFLFDFFNVRNKNRGLEIIFQERQGLVGEEYMLESGQKQILALANSTRGQFYSLATLLQIISFYSDSGRMPVFSISDAPEIAMRGFVLAAAGGAVPVVAELQRLLLKLALLRFNHFAMPAACVAGLEKFASVHSHKGAFSRAEMDLVAVRARKMGMEIFLLPEGAAPAPGQVVDRAGAEFYPAKLVFISSEASEKKTQPDAWFEDFLKRCNLGKAQGGKILVWADRFADHPEWIRKIPRDVLVFQRSPQIGNPDNFKNKAMPFKKHHIPQVLCQTIWSRDRFIPAIRSSMAGISAAFRAAKAEKLAGVMLIGCESGGNGCLLGGSALLQFEAGCLLWSGRPPVPKAFSHWALGRDEPDLFRVYSFLAQVDHQLPHTHGQYLFEDPVFAAFSRPGDPREIEAHYRKAALYLKKRKIARNELTDFLNFTRQLCEFIAAKVEFSSRLGSLLEEQDGPEQIRRQAAWLGQGAEKLKNLYLELWRKQFQPENLPDSISGFIFLQERFQYLRQISSSPLAREKLFEELKNYSSLSSPAAPYSSEF
ncbi:MAG: beta-N-acetylhexosaminidase [Acidobacteria bacterium]|nr:beta-N-acetylhexosaminidase [Acidobacteriota bacterium]